MARQAKKGGEQGKNGEWYDGGQFLPSSEATVKGEFKVAKRNGKVRKIEIEPYTWVEAPEGKASLYNYLAGIFGRYNRATKQIEFDCNEQTLNYFKTTKEEVMAEIDRFNAGERFRDIPTD